MLRQLLRVPSFTLPVVAGLALSIGAATAVFSVFNAMLLRSMGFRDPHGIVAIWRTDEPHGQKSVEVSYRDRDEWSRTGALAEVALASSVNLDFTLLEGEPQQVDGTTVTGNFFRTVGATPLAGRLLDDADDRAGVPARVVISHRLWTSRFAADPAAVGRQIRLGPGSVTIVGVARPEFDYPAGVDVWVPLHAAWPDVEQSADLRVFLALGRLSPRATEAQALAALDAVARRTESPAFAGNWTRVRVAPILDEIYGAARPAVALLLAAVFLVLLIACVNATNLLLNRAAERGRELAIRTALGAGRSELIKLLLTESAVLSAAAGASGVLLAAAGVQLLARFAPAGVPRIADARLDPTVLAFALALTLLTVFLFGVWPALAASRRAPVDGLRLAGRGTTANPHRGALRRWLIAGEAALCAILLAGAGLLVHSFLNLAAIDPGFRADRILTFRVTLSKPDQPSRRAFYTALLDRIRALPGVESAAAVLLRPLSGAVGWDTTYLVEGQPAGRENPNPNGNYEAISPDYFRTMSIALLAGRDFTLADNSTSPGVVIVDEATARRHWPGGHPVGRRLRLGGNPQAPWLTIVGVVKRVRYREWEAAWPDFYIPYTQRAQHRSDFVIKTHGDPLQLTAAVRREVLALDPAQPISNLTTLDTLVDSALSRSRFNGMIMAALGVCALVLAAIGIYSVLAYTVTARRTEIGVRVAVGASAAQVVRLIVADGMRPLAGGLVIGLLAAIASRKLVAGLLFGVAPFDLASYAFAAAALLGVALAACIAPALRAAAIDPARALKSE